MSYLAAVIGGYLAGSIPTGYWLVRIFRGIDIRRVGSHSIGATNVWRAMGWKLGGRRMTERAAQHERVCAGVERGRILPGTSGVDQFSTERERPPFTFMAPPGNVAPRNVQLDPVHWYQLLSVPRT